MFKFQLLFFVMFSFLLVGCSDITQIPPPKTKDIPSTTLQEIQSTVAYPTSTANLPESFEQIYDISVSRDKQNIAVFTTEGIYLYDSATLTLQQLIETKFEYPQQSYHRLSPSITFTPDGKMLVFSNKNYIYSWDLLDKNENEYLDLAISMIPEWDISRIEYSPKGDRIMITTYGGHHKCDGVGVNFALYDVEFNLLFDQYFCTANLENYYRFTSDNKVYVFYNARSMFFPLEFYILELSNGNVEKKIEYDPYSGNAENFIYDVSPDGQLLAVGNYTNYQFSTKIIEANSGNSLQAIDGGIDFSLDGIGRLRKSNANEIVNEKCNIINIPDEGNQYIVLISNDSKLVTAVSDWYPFADMKNNKSLELWDLSTCEIEKTISFPLVQ